jgi:hypothetical protein
MEMVLMSRWTTTINVENNFNGRCTELLEIPWLAHWITSSKAALNIMIRAKDVVEIS